MAGLDSKLGIVCAYTGIVGCAGLQPTVAAIEQGKDICLANKETLIAGGPYVLPLAAKYGVNILPADSEHSAIFQCIQVQPLGSACRARRWAQGDGRKSRETFATGVDHSLHNLCWVHRPYAFPSCPPCRVFDTC